MVLAPLSPAEVMTMTGLSAAEAFDAHPITGGLPLKGRIVAEAVERGWTSWRGRAIEPVVRESPARLLPDGTWPRVREVGGWWPRTNNPEVDLVGADRSPARVTGFVGSIKWHEHGSFDRRALASPARVTLAVPGPDEDTPLVAVSRSGSTVDGLTATYGPSD